MLMWLVNCDQITIHLTGPSRQGGRKLSQTLNASLVERLIIQRFAKQPRILGVVEKITAAGNEMAVNVDDCQLPAK